MIRRATYDDYRRGVGFLCDVILNAIATPACELCANKVVAGVRRRTLLPTMRRQDARQSTRAQQIIQLEGLAVAIPWGSSPPFRRRVTHYVYLLRCADNSLYVGETSNLQTRERHHNEGRGGSYTAKRRPVHIVYAEQYRSREEAQRRGEKLIAID
jgi:putative endonuclease